jgi:hypothetical protein
MINNQNPNSVFCLMILFDELNLVIGNCVENKIVKNLRQPVIPAEAGIQELKSFQIFTRQLDSRLRRDFNGVIYCTYQLVVTIVSDCFF